MTASVPPNDLFDTLRQNWKTQTAPEVDLDQLRQRASEQLQTQNRKYLRTIIGVSISFVAVIAFTMWIFLHFDDHGPFFYGSILAMDVLLVVYLSALWVGNIYQKNMPELTNLEYVELSLRKLRFRRMTWVYFTPAYSIILFTALCFYYADWAKEASLTWMISVYGLTFVYIVLVNLLSRKKSRRKVAELETLIAEMETLRNGFKE